MKGKSKPSMEMVRSCDKNDELHLGEQKTHNSSIVGPKISCFSTSKCYKISVVGGGGQGCTLRIIPLVLPSDWTKRKGECGIIVKWQNVNRWIYSVPPIYMCIKCSRSSLCP